MRSKTLPARSHAAHTEMVRDLQAALTDGDHPIRLKKRTSSNLFRYDGRSSSGVRALNLSGFDRPLHVDLDERTLDVQGLTTYERVVDAVLPSGLLPTITPELKHITVGGAIVGIGIESNSFRYGFVHNALVEAEVLLADGRVVVCTPENEHADLFGGLPNSYGTLGYILRATLQLRPAKPYVHLHTRPLGSVRELTDALAAAVDDPEVGYLECLAYAKDRIYLTTGRECADAAGPVTSIYGETVFYREISRPGELTLTTRDYLFRYDPEWFWALPDSRRFRVFRRYAPRALRHSSVYARYVDGRRTLLRRLPAASRRTKSLEQLIQDWEVPWPHAGELLEFVFDTVDLDGKPLMVTPVRVPVTAPFYPLRPDELYLNVGSYNYVKRESSRGRYESTRAIDEFCFGHGGLKMLYSSSFLGEEEFGRLYGGTAYDGLKRKYDPDGRFPTLYDKAVRSR